MADTNEAQLPTLVVGNYSRANWRLSESQIYALGLISVEKTKGNDEISRIGARVNNSFVIDPSRTSGASLSFISSSEAVVYCFGHNPQSLTQDSPPAVTIQPTFGGVFVEHQGQPFANISFSGTFGIRPRPKAQQTTVLGVSLPSLFSNGVTSDLDTGLPAGETTGFDDMHNLRVIFSSYFKAKVTGSNTVMLWTNAKNGDAYIVEPVGSGLVISRDKSSPMSASYQVSLRAIKTVDSYLAEIKPSKKSSPSLIQKLTQLSAQIRQAGNFIQSFSDRLSGVTKASLNTFLGIATDTVEAISSVTNGVTTVMNIPREAVRVAFGAAKRALTALDAVIGLVEAGRGYTDPYKRWGIESQLAELKHTVISGLRALNGVSTEKALFATVAQSSFGDTAARYAPSPRTSAVLAPTPTTPDVINQRAPGGASYAYVRPQDTIRSIALRYLGDAAQWQILARLNNLRAPYISPAGDGRSVLRPGQNILVPSAGDNGQTPSISPATQQYPYRAQATAFDDVLGVDAKLLEYDGQGTMESYDLVLDETGDVARVRGQANMNQAIALKFATENGELPLHPEIGVAANVGARVRSSTFGAINFSARAALLADPRITSIEGLSITIDGSTLNYTGSVQLAGGAGSLSLDYVLR